jgi:hypothetical protein
MRSFAAVAAVIPLLAAPAGPVLTEDSVMWAQSSGARYTVHLGTPSRTVATIPERDPNASVSRTEVRLSRAPGGAVFAATGLEDPDPRACSSDCPFVRFGRVGFASGAGAETVVSDQCQVRQAEAGDGVLGYVRGRCPFDARGAADTAVVRGPGGTWTFAVGRSDRVEVAGRYAAWRTRDADGRGVVTVLDAVAGTEVDRFPADRLADLQGDGRTLVDVAGRAATRPLGGEVQPLPVEAGQAGVLDADRVLVGGVGTFDVLDLDGRSRRVVTLGGTERHSGADLRGDRIAWTRLTCTGAELHVHEITTPVSYTSSGPCRISLRRPLRAVDLDGYVRLNIVPHCEGTRAPCPDGGIRVETVDRFTLGGRKPRRRVLAEPVGTDDPLFLFDGEHSLTRDGGRLLARRSAVRVRLSARGLAPATFTLRVGAAARRSLRACIRFPDADGCPG